MEGKFPIPDTFDFTWAGANRPVSPLPSLTSTYSPSTSSSSPSYLSVLAEETTLAILSFSSSHNFFFKYTAFVGSVPRLGLSNSASRYVLFFTEKEQD